MQRADLLSFVRKGTTLTQKCRSFASSGSSLLSDSHSVHWPHPGIYFENRKIGDLIKSGCLNDAQKVFNEMSIRDAVTYNLLISGYGRCGHPKQALHHYSDMVLQGFRESAYTFCSVVSICSGAGFHREGIQVHCRVILLGFELNLYIGSSLVDLYMHMGLDDVALKLFNELPERNLATWNLALRGFCELGKADEVLGLYHKMKLQGLEPNGLSFCYLIRSCCDEKFSREGKQLHAHVIKVGWTKSNVFVANALVDFYSACKSVNDARKSFVAISMEDVISWNSIVSLCADNGLLCDALELFRMMQYWGKRPSVRSFLGFLNCSSGRGYLLFGRQIHCFVIKIGFYHEDVHIQSALINMYGKCSDIESSVSIYESSPERNLECCNSLMTSLLHCGIIVDVLEMFGLMVDEGIGPDEVTLSITLKALSVPGFASLPSCRLLHCFAVKSGLDSDFAVSCSLIDCYSRCGHVELSAKVFEELPLPNVVCFTAIINGFARNGMGREAVNMLESMIQKDLIPDKVTFLCALNGCNHSGLVEEGKMVFNLMKSVYGVYPERQHYSCMVDLLGRAGLLNEAEELLQQAPGRGGSVMWSSLLRSCRVHRKEVVGKRAAKVLMDLEPDNFAVYLQASNFYSELGEFETSLQIRETGMVRKLTREIGHSCIEVNH
ncbi:hypothetical protein SLE2022_203180 [Rubroshorea leprosula]